MTHVEKHKDVITRGRGHWGHLEGSQHVYWHHLACVLAASVHFVLWTHDPQRPLSSMGENPAKVFSVALGHWVPAFTGTCLCLPEVILIIARALSAVSLGQRINLPGGLCSVFPTSLHSAQCSFVSLTLNLL